MDPKFRPVVEQINFPERYNWSTDDRKLQKKLEDDDKA